MAKKKQKPATEQKPTLDQAFNMMRAWYHDEIRSLVDSAIEEAKTRHVDGDDEDSRRERMTDWVDETTDGHEYVIYTFKAKCVCLASDNEDAYADEIGEAPPTVEAQACMAMRRDVWDLLEAREDEWIPSDTSEDK